MPEYERERRVTEIHDPSTDPTEPIRYDERRRVVEHESYADRPRRVIQDSVVEREGYPDPHLQRVILYHKISNVVWSLTGLIEVLIGLRVLLKLIAANPGNGFVDFIYSLSGVFVNPFIGIVNDPTSGSSVLEINSLIAMVVYLLLAWVILKLVWLVFHVSEPTDA